MTRTHKNKSDRKFTHSIIRLAARFLLNLSGCYLGIALTIIIIGVFTKSMFFIKNNSVYFLPAILVVPLYYLDRYVQKLQ